MLVFLLSPHTLMTTSTLRLSSSGFYRTVRLKHFFSVNESIPVPNITGLHGPSSFFPPAASVSKDILTFENAILTEVDLLFKNLPYSRLNLSKTEHMALKSLQNLSDVVIKPADKGGGIVLLNKTDYDHELSRQLLNTSHYRKLASDPTNLIRKIIQTLSNSGLDEGLVSPKEHSFLNKADFTTPAIYILRKIHKNPINRPGRPIVSGCNSILKPLAQYVDFFLKPFVTKNPSHIRDSTSVINCIEGFPFDSNACLLVTMDIESLYTNIPQDAALQIIFDTLESRHCPHRPISSPNALKLPLTKTSFCLRLISLNKLRV